MYRESIYRGVYISVLNETPVDGRALTLLVHKGEDGIAGLALDILEDELLEGRDARFLKGR